MLLNQWMASEDDEIFKHFTDSNLIRSEPEEDFYRQIKTRFPETVFYGVDVDHAYHGGPGRLALMEAKGLKDTEDYRLVDQNCQQGAKFYELKTQYGEGFTSEAWAYREDRMYENFVRTFDALGGEDVMCVFGANHVQENWDSLGQKLRARYGDQVSVEDLVYLREPLETVELEVNGKTYPADYYGEYVISGLPGYKSRAFWRLEGAYDDLSAWTTTGNVLPVSNYPVRLEEGQAYAIHYFLADGSERWEYHVCNGYIWKGMIATQEVKPPAAS